jgi:hypothetical protein
VVSYMSEMNKLIDSDTTVFFNPLINLKAYRLGYQQNNASNTIKDQHIRYSGIQKVFSTLLT